MKPKSSIAFTRTCHWTRAWKNKALHQQKTKDNFNIIFTSFQEPAKLNLCSSEPWVWQLKNRRLSCGPPSLISNACLGLLPLEKLAGAWSWLLTSSSVEFKTTFIDWCLCSSWPFQDLRFPLPCPCALNEFFVLPLPSSSPEIISFSGPTLSHSILCDHTCSSSCLTLATPVLSNPFPSSLLPWLHYILLLCRWKQNVPQKQFYPPTRQHCFNQEGHNIFGLLTHCKGFIS